MLLILLLENLKWCMWLTFYFYWTWFVSGCLHLISFHEYQSTQVWFQSMSVLCMRAQKKPLPIRHQSGGRSTCMIMAQHVNKLIHNKVFNWSCDTAVWKWLLGLKRLPTQPALDTTPKIYWGITRGTSGLIRNTYFSHFIGREHWLQKVCL